VADTKTTRPTNVEARLRATARAPWLSDWGKRALNLDYEEVGLQSPVVTSHRIAELGDGLKDVVNLSAGGQIHRDPPQFVMDAVRQAVDEKRFHYPGVRGDGDLRVALAEKLACDNGIQADPDTEILPTIGAQMPIDGAIRLLVNPGDDVLLLDPEYASIEPVVRGYGGNVISVPAHDTPSGWVFDPDDVRKRVTPKTKLFAFSNGHNPTGLLFSREQLHAIADLAHKHGFWIFSDEEYEKLVFDGRKHTSIAALPGMFERTVSAYSFSKAYCMSGLRIGYMAAPAAFMDHMYNVIRFEAQAVGALGQRAALAVLRGPSEEWLRPVIADLQADRDYLVARLNAMPHVRAHTPVGCYFVYARVDRDVPSWELAERLLLEARISVISGTNCGRSGKHYLRLSGCVGRQRLVEGLDRMERMMKTL